MAWGVTPRATARRLRDFVVMPPDSTGKLQYPIKDKKPYEYQNKKHPLDLPEPSNIKERYILDPDNYQYNRSSKIGSLDYKLPASSSINEQLKQDGIKNNKEYFRQRSQAQNFAKGKRENK